jgi:hypothetical protein
VEALLLFSQDKITNKAIAATITAETIVMDILTIAFITAHSKKLSVIRLENAARQHKINIHSLGGSF